jgi:hypothetical protein
LTLPRIYGPLGTVHLTMPLASWLGLSDAPGAIDGLGPAAQHLPGSGS